MRAATYSRFSSDKQREASITDQERNCAKRIATEGWDLVAEYADRGISGSRSDRPDYQRMMAAAKRHEFDVLLVDDLSRLSRDTIEAERAARSLEHAGVRVIAVSDGYDSNSKGRKIHRGMKNLMNDVFLDDLREKTHRGLTGQALKGLSAGGKAYGYRPVRINDPTRRDSYDEPAIIGYRREIVPEQAAVVRQIFEWYVAGKSPRWIAAELNNRGVPSPGSTWKRTGGKRRDAKWLASTIHGDMTAGTGILGNPLYIGVYIWNRTQWVKNPDTQRQECRQRPESEWTRTELPELRIIPDELWQKVKARQAARRAESTLIDCHLKKQGQTQRASYRTVAGCRSKYALSGLLKCGECGCSFVIANQREYACASHTNGGAAACNNNLHVRRDLVEERVLGTLRGELMKPDSVKQFQAALNRQLGDAHKRANSDAAERERRLGELDPEIDRMVAAVAEGLLSPALRTRLRAATQPQSAKILSILPDALARYEKAIRELPATLGRDVDRARRVLKRLLGEIKLRATPEGDALVAEIRVGAGALLRLVSNGTTENCVGSGGRI